MKKIIHFKIPTNDSGHCLIDNRTLGEFNKYLKKVLPKYYFPIFTPFEVSIKNNKIAFDTTSLQGKISKENIEYIRNKIEKQGYLVEIIK